MSNELVDARLSDEEAKEFSRLVSELYDERQEQFNKQGMSNEPISYENMIASGILGYFKERYDEVVEDDE